MRGNAKDTIVFLGNALGNCNKNEHPQTGKSILGNWNEHPSPKIIWQPWLAENTDFLRRHMLHVYPATLYPINLYCRVFSFIHSCLCRKILYRECHKRCTFLSLATDEGCYRVVARSHQTLVKAQLLDTNNIGFSDSRSDIFYGAPCIKIYKILRHICKSSLIGI